jgi:mono/diheme cytochrome c family protein
MVYGMAAKTPRAYDLLTRAKTWLQNTPTGLLGADSAAERELLARAQESLRSVGTQRPLALGLDTTVALVSLSLAHRETDRAASLSPTYSRSPRPDVFDFARADSKPLDWWGVKYKDRYLSDGALVHGDIMVTNFLWNEIGRGTDLNALAAWIKANPTVVSDLNRMVRSAVPPRIGDFVATPIDTTAAQHGEILYLGNCASCHGIYEKNWGKGTATVRVDYPKPTQVMDVGTDPNRAAGTAAIADRLNRLEISVKYGLVVQPTGGYVAPPLVGVWSRYPYLHNRSVPNLCELLKPAKDRVARYYVGTTDIIATDYDAACVGYPTADVPAAWRTWDRAFDTRVPGLSNAGHEYFTAGSDMDKRDLIEYLKTL